MRKGKPESMFVVENVTRRSVLADRIRLAKTSAERRRGLLDAREIDSHSGLWINPCEAVHTFGMRIPLDVVFLDGQLRVRKIARQLKPNRIAFCLVARSVLEIRAGSAGATQTQCGDQLSLRRVLQPEDGQGPTVAGDVRR